MALNNQIPFRFLFSSFSEQRESLLWIFSLGGWGGCSGEFGAFSVCIFFFLPLNFFFFGFGKMARHGDAIFFLAILERCVALCVLCCVMVRGKTQAFFFFFYCVQYVVGGVWKTSENVRGGERRRVGVGGP
ncbi:hypothetical protein T440DRAFT_120218 [Plenodomus tracheiphilus IPT5]|uniref:Uncharacterized protein n=1 Tax=Plenodomus tracheiphilus IPT5 TaxID=1408161 RepID=A0A6A7B6E5_9PLEO|nr:hypothetical protein T440DRAFT_120218 [Plenodomus tracheiphilus IPT5]